MNPVRLLLLPSGVLALIVMALLTPCGRRPSEQIRLPGASVYLYDLSNGVTVAELKGHNRPTTALAVSKDGALALTASLTPELRLWSLGPQQQLRTLELGQRTDDGPPLTYRGPACTLAFLDGTNTALIGHEQGGLNVWDLETGGKKQSFRTPFGEAHAVVISPDGRTVTATSPHNAITISWSLADGSRQGLFTEEWIEGSPWVTLARDGQARSWWNADTSERLPESQPLPEGRRVASRHQSTLSPDGRKLLTYYGGVENQPGVHRFQVWELESGELLCQRTRLTLPIIHARSRSGCEAFAFSPDSTLLAVGTSDGRIELHEVQGGSLRKVLSGRLRSCDYVRFIPDGKRLLTWSRGTARIWDLESATAVLFFAVPGLTCLEFTPDGRYLLVGGGGEFSGL